MQITIKLAGPCPPDHVASFWMDKLIDDLEVIGHDAPYARSLAMIVIDAISKAGMIEMADDTPAEDSPKQTVEDCTEWPD